ncbi:phosphoribosylglycinamide formyltransferase [Sediminicoccus sp. KRV36]|uniref:phosphoribosylglycinamide formyltransferase n=1 Tax=Sediminicoccus sp. KRV36 TaxID=3133721 RepID=UPI00200C4709|nr:phosphoribosylglycinamide formyltransferase [Sediminicoccus rosea]
MVALLEAAAHPDYPAEIALVVSNRADAAGLDRAREMGVPALAIPSRARPREAFEAELAAVLAQHQIAILALAGFMRVLTEGFVQAWEGRMINIHPSLLPSFPGLDTHARALAGGVRLHGCTVHLVSPGVDEGPILAQAAVPVLAHDTEASLAARVLEQEHRLYPAALAWLAAGRVRVQEGRAHVAATDARGRLVNPLPAGAAVSTQPLRD